MLDTRTGRKNPLKTHMYIRVDDIYTAIRIAKNSDSLHDLDPLFHEVKDTSSRRTTAKGAFPQIVGPEPVLQQKQNRSTEYGFY